MEFSIRENLITQRARDEVNTDTVDSLIGYFYFTDDWYGLTKTVSMTKGTTVKTAVISNDILNFSALSLTSGTWQMKITSGSKTTENAVFVVEEVETAGAVTDEQVETAVASYLEDNPVSGMTVPSQIEYVSSMDDMTNVDKLYVLLDNDADVTYSNSTVACGFELTIMVAEWGVKAIVFMVKKGQTYTITKSGISDRDRINLFLRDPATYSVGSPAAYTILDLSDSSVLSHTFTAPDTGYCLYTYTKTDHTITFTIKTTSARTLVYAYLSNEWKVICDNTDLSNYVKKKMPIDSSWDSWDDIRYYYGFNKEIQPIFNTVNGVLESDTMLSVRGGKGRWNKTDNPTSSFVSGGHVFEGWSGQESCRLTMLMGKFHETFACIQTYSPPGLYETSRRFGWVKIGSDELLKGADFSENWATLYTPLTLAPLATAPSSVSNYDLNPQMSDYSASVPVGTMYYDTTLGKVRVYTADGWKSLSFEN